LAQKLQSLVSALLRIQTEIRHRQGVIRKDPDIVVSQSHSSDPKICVCEN